MNNPIVLFVDDELERRDEFRKRFGDVCILHSADNPLMAIQLLRTTKFDVIFLDHDLGSPLNGFDVVCCMFNSTNQKVPVMVHSANTSAALRMVQMLKDLGHPVRYNCFLDEVFWETAEGFIKDA